MTYRLKNHGLFLAGRYPDNVSSTHQFKAKRRRIRDGKGDYAMSLFGI